MAINAIKCQYDLPTSRYHLLQLHDECTYAFTSPVDGLEVPILEPIILEGVFDCGERSLEKVTSRDAFPRANDSEGVWESF